MRSTFGLIQTGRLIQYAGFWLASYLGLKFTSLVFNGFALTSRVLASFILFELAFGAATAFGEIPIRGRTWLPMRRSR